MSHVTSPPGTLHFDFNEAQKQGDFAAEYNLDDIRDALRATAMSWVPDLFPNGRRVEDEWVLGGIDGRAAAKDGSCKINLRGRFAGSWREWDDDTRGGPIDTVRQGTGLDGRELYAKCAELAGSRGPEPQRHARGYRAAGPVDRTNDIAFVLQGAISAAGTLIETAYFPSRGLPWSPCDDLLFSPDVAHFGANRGFPVMIARLRNARGELPCVHNAIIALRHAPEWAGVLWLNEMSQRVTVRRPLPWSGGVGEEMRWADHLDVLTASWLQTHGIMAPTTMAGDAVRTVARECRYHPVRDYLDGLAWDGLPRLDTWLIDRCGADDTPYTRSIAAAWMISAVARAMRPGCKADCALILEGPQGLKKSTVAKVLGGDWFTDNIGKMGERDSIMRAMPFWIVEIAELDGMNRAEVDTVKAFLSCTEDNFRPPYGRETVDNKRQFVFIGTVNPNGNGYIKDDTGGRRFWPVLCRAVTDDGKVDVDGLMADRDQLWAEATARFKAGEPWWLTGDAEAVATEQQSLRQDDDEWLSLVGKFVEWRDEVTSLEVLTDGLKLTPDKMGRAEQMRVARCLKRLGFDKQKKRLSSSQTQWVYVRSASR
ncbi:hypothetical protein GCM10011611_38920 [Aliidongia dinghuensis]|uniref:Virulence-associated protein E-like domain-containing protein n=1 Tax=Aliidongia dinghuensis TaxID=1867774 RepID=A0A8J2YXK5_9PROT|nr:virulence-associated E family protein [Aliidongia dinghuensis]GGF29063.1 hypothetical protein GCM10011611_38920 [Aliidongia dinghuensis]